MAVGTTILAARTKVIIDSTDFSGDYNQCSLNFTQSEIDVSTFGTTGWAKHITGISTGSIDMTGFGQAAGHTLDSKLWGMLGAPSSTTAMEVDVPTSNVGDIRWTFNVFLKSYKVDLKPVDAYKLSASVSITGAPTRATISS